MKTKTMKMKTVKMETVKMETMKMKTVKMETVKMETVKAKPLDVNHTLGRRLHNTAACATLCLSLLGSIPVTAQNANTLGNRIPAPVFSNVKVKPAVLDAPGKKVTQRSMDRPLVLDPIIVPTHPIATPARLRGATKLSGPMMTLQGHIPSVARTATRVGPLDPSSELTLSLMLRPRNQAQMDDMVKRLYDTNDPMFHRFLTPKQRIENFSPTQEEFNKVVAFAQQKGLQVTDSTVDRQIVRVTGSVDHIQRAFSLHLNQYQGPDGAAFYAPDAEPSVPSSIAPLLVGVERLSNASRPHSNAVSQPVLPLPTAPPTFGPSPADTGIWSGEGMSAGEIKKVFNLAYSNNGVPLTGAGQHVALVEFGGFDQSDINYYISYNAHAADPYTFLNYTPIQTHLMGGYHGGTNSNTTEVELDIELLEAVADGLTQIDVYEEDSTGSIVDELNQILNDDTANQISISYSQDEGSGFTHLNASDVNSLTELLALQGQAVFVSSGDWGAYGKAGAGLSVNGYAASPYVTGVGGTTLWINEFSDYGAFWYEFTWNNNGSTGGGISQYTSIPNYQYIYLLNDAYASSAGASLQNRNVPDVALDADPTTGYYTHIQGWDSRQGGTSASTPIWAAFWAHLNQFRSMYNIPPMGFANPALYAIASGANYSNDFRDVYGGNNNNYYYDTYGYDCTTGLGTLNGINMLNDLVNYGSWAPTEYLSIERSPVTSGQQIYMDANFSAPSQFSQEGYATVTYAILIGNYLYQVGQDTLPDSATSDRFSLTAPDVGSPTDQTYIYYVSYFDAKGKRISNRWSNYSTVTVNSNSFFAMSVAPNVTYDSQGATGTLQLIATAAQNELIDLTSSDPAHAAVPSRITVLQGQSSVTFPITTTPVAASEQVTIMATPDAASGLFVVPASVQFTVSPLLSGFSVAPIAVTGGATAKGTVTFAQNTPTKLTLKIASSDPSAIVPATVTVAAGVTSATVPIKTNGVAANKTATITVTQGSASWSAPLTVLPAKLVGVSVQPATVSGPTTVTGTARLNGKAPQNGMLLNITSSNPAVATTPSSVMVAANATAATFPINVAKVTTTARVKITVTNPATGTSVTYYLTVNP